MQCRVEHTESQIQLTDIMNLPKVTESLKNLRLDFFHYDNVSAYHEKV